VKKKGKANEEVLLRNLASFYVQQETAFGPGDSKLYRLVLVTFSAFRVPFQPLDLGRLSLRAQFSILTTASFVWRSLGLPVFPVFRKANAAASRL